MPEDAKPLNPQPASSPSKEQHHPALESLRQRIDHLDHELIRLLNERASSVVEVGKLKRDTGTPIYAPHRERAVIDRVLQANQGPLSDRTIEAIWREIMSGSFALEQPLRIGYLGPAGTFSHQAAVKHFGSSVEYADVHDIASVFTEVIRGHVDYGLAPIENSLGGGIVESLDALQSTAGKISIYAEILLSVQHALLATCDPRDVKRIHSKYEVFAQCRKFLQAQFPKAELVAAPSTVRAVQTARAENLLEPGSGSAAIASALAGQLADMNILFEGIQDDPNNITRFLVLSRQRARKSGNDKTSIMFDTEDKPGALAKVLTVFDSFEVNLSHLDKRPSRRENWTYTFFVDAIGHEEDANVQAAIAEVRKHCVSLKLLGSYPKAERIL